MSPFLGLSAAIRDAAGKGAIRSRLASGAFWSGTGQAVFRLFWFPAAVLIVRMLGREGFGRFSMVTSTVGMIGVLAGMGLSTSAIRYVAVNREKDKGKAGSLVGFFLAVALVSGVAGMVLVLAAAGPAAVLLEAPELKTPIRLLAPTILFNPVFWVMLGVLSGLEEFRLQALLWVIYGVLMLPLATGGVYFYGIRGGLVALSVVSFLISTAAIAVALLACREKGIKPGKPDWRGNLPILWAFSAPAYASGMIRSAVEWGARAVLVQFPGGYAALGIFEVARHIPRFLLTGVEVLLRPVLPVFSSLSGEGKHKEMLEVLRKVTLLLALAGGAAALVTVLLSKHLLAIYGTEYAAFGSVFALATAGMYLLAVRQPAVETLAATGRMWTVSFTDACWGIALVAAAYYLASEGWGALGLAAAYAAASLLHFGWTQAFVRLLASRLKRAG